MPRAWTLGAAAVALAVALALPFTLTNFRLFQFSQVYIYAIALLGLNILTGYNGQISLGHGAFYAVGAYTTAVMMDQWNVPYGWTIPTAGVICLVVGFLFGIPALRLEGLYLALATFALALAVPQILKYFEHWTGGSQGIVLSKPNAPLGLPLNPDQWLYFLTLAILVVLFGLAANLLRGPHGAGHRGHPRQRDRRPVHGGQHGPLQVADVRRERRLHRRGRRAERGDRRLRGARQLRRVPVHHVPGRHRDRRPRLDLRRHLRRPVHPVRARTGPRTSPRRRRGPSTASS